VINVLPDCGCRLYLAALLRPMHANILCAWRSLLASIRHHHDPDDSCLHSPGSRFPSRKPRPATSMHL